MEELDIKQLLQFVKKRWWIIVSCTVVFSIASALISLFMLTPVYQSDTTLYVGKNVDTSEAINYNELLLGNQLVNDYRELVKSRLVTGLVINKLEEKGVKGLVERTLASKLSVNSKKDTRMIEITVQDPDPELAKTIANITAEVFQQKAIEIMDIKNVKIIDTATVPVSPVKPNKKMNVAIAFVLGAMVGIGIIFLIEFFDNTIKTPGDVEKHIGIPVIGTIPVFPE